MTEKRYDVIDKEEPRGQSVTWDGIPCTARTCVTRLNRLTEENEELKKRNEWLITQISNLTMNMYKLGIKIELEDEDGNSFDFMEMILND